MEGLLSDSDCGWPGAPAQPCLHHGQHPEVLGGDTTLQLHPGSQVRMLQYAHDIANSYGPGTAWELDHDCPSGEKGCNQLSEGSPEGCSLHQQLRV